VRDMREGDVFIDYYVTLGVPQTASRDDIRASFRRLAKKHHPDLNPRSPKRAARKLKLVLAAYEILADEVRRLEYDRRLASYQDRGRDLRRDHLLRRRHRPEGWARLVLYDLMDGNQTEAIFHYEAGLASGEEFELERALPVGDWLDCKFLLAEGYARMKRHGPALDLYEEIFFAGETRSRRRYLLDEIRDRIRNLCCRTAARGASCEEAIGYYQRALRLGLPQADAAFLHKKMAECYHRLGDSARASRHLATAFELKPNLQGARKICDKLGFQVTDGDGGNGRTMRR